jgi:Domain of unknown function (DUF5753)
MSAANPHEALVARYREQGQDDLAQLIGYETEATEALYARTDAALPALVRHADYAEAVNEQVRPAEFSPVWQVALLGDRQRLVLGRPELKRLTFVLGEAALRTAANYPPQLRHLLQLADEHGRRLRFLMLPLGAPISPLPAYPFGVLSLPRGDIVCAEGPLGITVLDPKRHRTGAHNQVVPALIKGRKLYTHASTLDAISRLARRT